MLIWIHSPFDNLPHEGFRRQRYWLMAEAFAAAGHEVVYFTADFNHGTKRPRVCATPIPAPHIALRLIPAPPYRKNVGFARLASHRRYARNLEATVRELAASPASRPALVITATPTLGAAEAMRRVADTCGARFVVDVQDAWPETFYRLLPAACAWLVRILLARAHRTAHRLYTCADAVTGVSTRYAALVGRADYRVFYHGIEGGKREEVKAECGGGDCRRLFYLGNLGEGYDLQTVLEVMVQESDLTLDIAGKGPREDALRAMAETLGLGNRVRFHGYLDATAVYFLAATCGVGIIPMRDDSWVGLPYKLGDYLIAGLRVVSSLHGECGALLEKDQLGATYTYGSSASLAAALRAVRALPRTRPALPATLDAALIYPAYVQAVL